MKILILFFHHRKLSFLDYCFDRHFSSSTNNIQARITKMMYLALQNDKEPLATQYGAIAGLGEMGAEVSSQCNHSTT